MMVPLFGVGVIAKATQVLLIIPKLVLNCSTQPKEFVRQICCNCPEIYFFILCYLCT